MKFIHLTILERAWRIIPILGILLLVILISGCSASPTGTTLSTQILASVVDIPTSEPTATQPPEPTATATSVPTATNTPGPTATFTPTPLPAMISDEKGAEMILIPAGPFVMGSNDNQAAAKPAHTVTLGDYYIDKYEVTNEQFLACVEAGVCSGGSRRLYNSTWVGHPVMDVTWFQAQQFCEWRGGSLPTEAQWEKAARGTDERIFPWGNDPVTCERARYGACGWFTVPVGQHPTGVSPFGVHDMAGNVWEWTKDWYKSDYFTVSPAENPTGPETDTGYKSTRGGAWFYQAGLMTSIWRNHAPPTAAYSYLGFRCIRNP